MRKTMLVALFAGAALAQSADEFDSWMRTIDDKLQAVERDISAKDGTAAAEDAKALELAFGRVEGFWKKRGNAQDAVDLSRKAGERAAAAVSKIAAKDFDGASSESIGIAATCTACHRLYRPLF